MGLVGAGFVGPHHIDAVRRLGFVDVVALAGSSDATAREQGARRSACRKATADYEALLDDPDVQVVHIATPNHLHYPVIARGDRQRQARRLRQAARDDRRRRQGARRSGRTAPASSTR